MELARRRVTAPSRVLLCVTLVTSPVVTSPMFPSLENMNTAELITSFGYPAERHQVESGDGFRLTVFRIPNATGPAVLFAHGILMASDNWVLRGPDKELAFMLADRGYDIWLADTRGNCYSHKHKTLNDKDPKFWDFSFDEMGYYDVPALIDYILSRRPDQARIFYIGFSLGTTMFYAMCDTRPDYNEKVHLMISLAPAVYLSKWQFLSDRVSTQLALWMRSLLKLTSEHFTHELLPRSKIFVGAARVFCSPTSITLLLCHFFIAAFFGISHPSNLAQIQRRYVANITTVLPSGTSVRAMDHLLQLATSRKFEHYDLRIEPNAKKQRRRRRLKPRLYNLTRVTAPTAIFYSQDDMLVPHENVNRLASELGNLVSLNLMPIPDFNHMDFLWGRRAHELVFEKIFQLMENTPTQRVILRKPSSLKNTTEPVK